MRMPTWKPLFAAIAISALGLGSYALVNRAARTERIEVPAGTRIQVRLDQGISTVKNAPGDEFTATLNAPLLVNGKLLAPEGSKVTGQLTQVKESGRVKGRASLTMELRELSVGRDTYDLASQPLTLVAPKTTKKDAFIIGGSAVLGTIVGAIAGGGKGAAIGAGVGGAGGTGFVLATRGKEIVYGPEARFTFTLAEPVDLPVAKAPKDQAS
jgi:hypothetical protein